MPQLSEMTINPAASQAPGSALPNSPVAEAPQQPGLGATAAPGEPGDVNPFNLPPAVANVPAVKLVSIGAPPAVRVGPGEYYPEIDPVIDHMDTVLSSGLDVYHAMDNSMVLFNPLFIQEAELQYLDQNGQLQDVVPDYGQVTGNQPQEIPDDQIAAFVDRGDAMAAKLNELSGPGEEEVSVQPAGQPTPVPQPSPAEQAAVVDNQSRAMRAFGGSPTSGPHPGGGRLLNALLQPPPR